MRIFLAVFGSILLCCVSADAQVVQPQYVRPSKGSPVQIASQPQSVTAIQRTSVYDMTTFSAVMFSAQFAQASGAACTCPADPCTYRISLGVEASTSKTGPFVVTDGSLLSAAVTNGVLQSATPAPVNVSTPYAKFYSQNVTFTDSTGAPVVADCYATVTATAIPFTPRVLTQGIVPLSGLIEASLTSPMLMGGSTYGSVDGSGTPELIRVNSDGVIAVGGGRGAPYLPTVSPISVAAAPGAATPVFSSDAVQSGVTLQNVGTVPVYCAVGTNSSSLSATRFNFVLGAGTASNNGTGGSKDIDQIPQNGAVYCLGNGGAGSVAITPY